MIIMIGYEILPGSGHVARFCRLYDRYCKAWILDNNKIEIVNKWDKIIVIITISFVKQLWYLYRSVCLYFFECKITYIMHDVSLKVRSKNQLLKLPCIYCCQYGFIIWSLFQGRAKTTSMKGVFLLYSWHWCVWLI